jgi:putative tricarboxylic transport membrane protein
MSPVSAIIMLAEFTMVLNTAGQRHRFSKRTRRSASVVTCLDGYQMARHGNAGPALAISAFGSFIGVL